MNDPAAELLRFFFFILFFFYSICPVTVDTDPKVMSGSALLLLCPSSLFLL